MIALKIEDLREFTKKLFLGETFDRFLTREAEIVTFNRFSIDGKVREGFYSKEEREEGRLERYSAWKLLRPYCFSLVKGSKLPESFQIVLQLPQKALERFLNERQTGLSPEQVNGLYLNLRYESQILTCVTGTSMGQFTLDKSLEREWDDSVRNYLKKQGIAFEEQ